ARLSDKHFTGSVETNGGPLAAATRRLLHPQSRAKPRRPRRHNRRLRQHHRRPHLLHRLHLFHRRKRGRYRVSMWIPFRDREAKAYHSDRFADAVSRPSSPPSYPESLMTVGRQPV